MIPKSVRFEGEEAGETVMFVLRAHFISNFSWIFITFILILVPLFISQVSLDQLLNLSLNLTRENIFLLTAAWYLAVFGFAFQQFLHWYFNIYILTNIRIVDIDFIGLFYRTVSQTTLNNIQDITYSKGGILQNFFDYGDLHIQTAGETANFEFDSIPDPEGNQKQILELVSKAKDGNL